MDLKNMSREEKIIHYYVDQQKSIRQTATIVRCNYKTVGETLRAHGLVRSRKEALKLRSTDEYISKVAAAKLGTKNASAKLDEERVREIRAEYEKMTQDQSRFKTKTELAKHFGVKRPTINDILFGRTWTHVK